MRIGKTIYLDHQATTPVDNQVLAEMTYYFTESFGNPHSSDHTLGWEASRAVDNAAARVARLIGADPDEIIFTSGATESNNLALLGLGRRMAYGKRWRILISDIEHKCVLAIGRVLQDRFGYTVEHIPVDQNGLLEISALEEALDEDVLAVSVMAVNNEIGTIQDIGRISELARNYGAVFHTDAVQAPITMCMSSFADHADILSLSSHKMYGPKGVGVIYVRRGLQNMIEPLFYGGAQQNGMRPGTVPVPLCVGMGAASDILVADDSEEKRVLLRCHRDIFIEKILSLRWMMKVNGPLGQDRHHGNVNIRFIGFSAHDILSNLQPRIAASTGAACSSGLPEPSHVLKAIGLSSTEAEASIRFSIGFGTSEDDIDEAVDLIDVTLEKLAAAGLLQSA